MPWFDQRAGLTGSFHIRFCACRRSSKYHRRLRPSARTRSLGRASRPSFRGIPWIRANLASPSISDRRRPWRNLMSQGNSHLVSVRILPNDWQSPGKAGRRGSELRSRSRPLHGTEIDRLRHLGTSRRRAKRDVPGPAILRQRRTPELRAAPSRGWRRQRAGHRFGTTSSTRTPAPKLRSE